MPLSLFDWLDEFNDDLGFEASSYSRACDSPPGSPEKIAMICERISRGQSLWHPEDAKLREAPDVGCEPINSYKITGDIRSGSVIGVDNSGGKHRYAMWMSQDVLLRSGRKRARDIRWLYVIEHPGKVDSWDRDDELFAIREHAIENQVSFIGVVSLYTARMKAGDEISSVAVPVTSISLVWARWMARYCDTIVGCWGRGEDYLNRDVDMLWLLSRTVSGGHVHVSSETPNFPGKLGYYKDASIVRYDARAVIEQRRIEDERLEQLASLDAASDDVGLEFLKATGGGDAD
jgi:hypothetical protein